MVKAHHPLSEQTIIFMPGMDGTGISFEPIGALLPKDVAVQIIRYPTDALLNFDETVQCAKEQMPPDLKRAIIIAESFSGPVASKLIGSGQITAKGLILCATFARTPRPVLLSTLNLLPLELLMRIPPPKLLLKLAISGGAETMNLFLNMWQRVKTLVPAKILAHRLKVINQVDVREWLPKITIPCLYIQALSDTAVPESCLLDFTNAIVDLKIEKIEGPHFILQARPHLSLAAIQNFVSHITD